jgi:hypothetical protein
MVDMATPIHIFTWAGRVVFSTLSSERHPTPERAVLQDSVVWDPFVQSGEFLPGEIPTLYFLCYRFKSLLHITHYIGENK